MQYKNLRLYHNLQTGTKKFIQSPEFIDIEPVTNEDMFLGWDGANYFKGDYWLCGVHQIHDFYKTLLFD